MIDLFLRKLANREKLNTSANTEINIFKGFMSRFKDIINIPLFLHITQEIFESMNTLRGA
jgi:predicted nucleic acid-binding protein